MSMGTEYWASHIAAAKLEAIPASEYARRHGLSVSALYYWQRKLKNSDPAGIPVPGSKFVSLRIAPSEPHPNHCTLELPSGIRLGMPSLPSPEWLAALARAVPGAR
jgi:transposase-like protein